MKPKGSTKRRKISNSVIPILSLYKALRESDYTPTDSEQREIIRFVQFGVSWRVAIQIAMTQPRFLRLDNPQFIRWSAIPKRKRVGCFRFLHYLSSHGEQVTKARNGETLESRLWLASIALSTRGRTPQDQSVLKAGPSSRARILAELPTGSGLSPKKSRTRKAPAA